MKYIPCLVCHRKEEVSCPQNKVRERVGVQECSNLGSMKKRLFKLRFAFCRLLRAFLAEDGYQNIVPSLHLPPGSSMMKTRGGTNQEGTDRSFGSRTVHPVLSFFATPELRVINLLLRNTLNCRNLH